MDSRIQADLATTRKFVARINAGDLDGLVALMTPDHLFYVEGEEPIAGKETMREAWAGYFAAFPAYLIHADEYRGEVGRVLVVGHTTGSHLPPMVEEMPRSAIWEARVADGLVAAWIIRDATPENRQRFNLP